MDDKPGLFRSWTHAIIAIALCVIFLALVCLAVYLTI